MPSSGDGFDALLRAVAESPPVPLASVVGDRFALVRRLGEGTFGVVYEAEDRTARRRVALKMLRHPHPDWIHRFKREFRTLRDLTHHGIVQLDELFCIDGRWFFTMELLDGTNILDHVRGHVAVADGSTLPLLATPAAVERMHDVLAQVAGGLAVLHQQGWVHRDIKPSNVLVTRQGRAVILDFGLVADTRGEQSSAIVGTPAYMAPEQRAGGKVTSAADLYAVGVLLHEMVAGRRPEADRVDPSLPDELAALCRDLLSPDPARRPTASELKRRLRPDAAAVEPVPAPLGQVPFVGRSVELAALHRAYETARRDGGAICILHGESGIGKSRTMHHFLDQLRASEGASVFAGQCHEREAVPFKAIDGVVDALIAFLLGRPKLEVAAILPTRPAALVQVFPALLRVPAVQAQVARGGVLPQADIRSRAFLDLRDLWTRLAQTRPVVIAIDDLQWADHDGLRALAEIMRRPEAPPLLLLGTVRTAPGDQDAVARLRAALESSFTEVQLDCLDDHARLELAERLAGTRTLAAPELERVGVESRGHPLFVEHLVDLLDAADEDLSLDRAIVLRTRDLTPEQRRLAELTAVSGKPVKLSVAAAAANIERGELPAAMRQLLDRRIGRWDGEQRLDVYHGRVRDALATRLDADHRKELHASLATAYEREADVDSESIAYHWQEAGELERALPYVIRAGDAAAATFAFERAAEWYRRALETVSTDGELAVELRCKLGEAYANAGRGALAAAQFAEAAAASPPERALALRQREADQLMRTGHMERGMAVTTRVLGMVGIAMPANRLALIASLLVYRLRLALRGLRFRETANADLPADDRTRVDVCLMAAYSLSFVDPLRGLWLQSKGLWQALRLGEAGRISRAVSLELGYLGSYGRPARERLRRLGERAREIATSRESSTLILASLGSSCFLNGEFAAALTHTDEAIARLEQDSPGLVHELVTMRMFSINMLGELGRFDELRRRQQLGLRDALARGDVYGQIMFSAGLACLGWLVDDQPDAALAAVTAAMQAWPTNAIHLEHLYELSGRFLVSAYVGDPHAAVRLADEYVRAARGSMFHRIQKIRIAMHYYRGCAALMAASAGDRSPLRVATRAARAIERERSDWGDGFVAYLRAGVLVHQGQTERAAAELARAATHFERRDMLGYAAAVTERAARMRGGDAHETARARALAYFHDHHVVAPDRLIEMLAPGLRPPAS